MRNLLTLSTLILVTACEGGPAALQEPPVLKVTSPMRGTVRDHAGPITVTGTATANAQGVAVAKVTVNDVPATVAADGTFRATIDLAEGATLIETVARGADGTTTSDTRAIQAGTLKPVGSEIPSAIAVAMSTDSFAKIAAAAGPMVKGLDLGAMLAPMQPMVRAGTDCNGIRVSVDDVELADVKLALTPVQNGLAIRAELDGVDVPGHASYSLICADFSQSLRVRASKVVVAGTLSVTPNGMAGFTTKLNSPQVTIDGLQLSAGGIPDSILNLLNFNNVLGTIAGKAAELAMNPVMNQALGALAGPQHVDLLGKQMTLQVAPSAIAFEPGGASLKMNLKVLLAGAEASPGFIYTANGAPTLDADHGFQLGIADDLANEMLAELHATGALSLSAPVPGGAFDAAKIDMTLAPMISADATDGQLRLILGDMYATFTSHGTPVAKAAINARVDLKVAPTENGYSVALQLGTPELHVNFLDDLANTTGVDGDDLGHAVEVTLAVQLAAITKLLVAIPLPAVAGLAPHNLGIASDAGYVMISGELQ
jgi:hypothetical protein